MIGYDPGFSGLNLFVSFFVIFWLGERHLVYTEFIGMFFLELANTWHPHVGQLRIR